MKAYTGVIPLLLSALVLEACSPLPLKPWPENEKVARPPEPVSPAIFRRLPTRLSVADFSRLEPVRLVVRKAAQADLENEDYRRDQAIAGSLSAFGGGSAALGAAVAPMVGGALLVGGVLLGVAAGALVASEQKEQSELEQALKETDWVALLDQGFTSALQAGAARDTAATLEIVPLRYGVTETKGAVSELCAVAQVLVSLRRGDVVLYRDSVSIAPYERSGDAPVPVCRSRTRMSEKGALALRQAFSEYAAAIPLIVKERIPGLPWKP